MYGDSGVKYKEPSPFNLVSFVMFLLLVILVYGGWKYIPVYWEKQEIQEMMQGVLINANRASNEGMQTTVLTRMQTDFGLKNLKLEDVQLHRSQDWIDVQVKYEVVIPHPLQKVHVFWVTATAKRRIIDL